MNIVGIIAEYNPMHNGHIYHIKKAKELSNADYAIVIMSGSFTEQGNIAVLDKFTRARIAIENGADLVIELPTIHATSSAEGFAKGAVNILNSLGCVTHLAFGAETDNIESLSLIAKTCIDKETDIISATKEYLKQGVTAAKARDEALKRILPNECYEMINTPNNILGIEYLKALYALKSQIKPVLVKRLSSNHNEYKIDSTSEFTSSTAIRKVLLEIDKNGNNNDDDILKIQYVVPQNTLNELKHNNYKTNEWMWDNLKYEVIKLGKDGLKNIAEVTEGLENKLYDSLKTSNSYEEYIANVKSKRYTLSRIKRICVYIILGITKDLKNNLQDVNYARVLKLKNSSKDLLAILNKNCNNDLITKITEDSLNSLDEIITKSIKLDILANNLVGNISSDYTNNIIYN